MTQTLRMTLCFDYPFDGQSEKAEDWVWDFLNCIKQSADYEPELIYGEISWPDEDNPVGVYQEADVVRPDSKPSWY